MGAYLNLILIGLVLSVIIVFFYHVISTLILKRRFKKNEQTIRGQFRTRKQRTINELRTAILEPKPSRIHELPNSEFGESKNPFVRKTERDFGKNGEVLGVNKPNKLSKYWFLNKKE